MTIYAESSAILAWLLGEPRAETVRRCLADHQFVIASDLTLVECDRVITRATTLGEMTEGDAAKRRAELVSAAANWTLLRISGPVIERARRQFPIEPVRTLDALHLASALVAKSAVPDLEILSLDHAIRANARDLGISSQPSED